jgi:hypothetical protein
VWRKEGPLENFNPESISDKDFINQKFFLIEYLEGGGWNSFVENVRPYVGYCLDKGIKIDEFFFDSFEHFL